METRGKREAGKPSVSRYKQSQFPASVRAGGKDFACTTTKRQYSRFRTDPEASKEGREGEPREEALPLFFKTWTRYFFNKVTWHPPRSVKTSSPIEGGGRRNRRCITTDRLFAEKKCFRTARMGLRVMLSRALHFVFLGYPCQVSRVTIAGRN